MAENIKLPASASSKVVDTFVRAEGTDEVHMQAVVNVDPSTGLPNAATEVTLDTILLLLGAILEKLPRINANDRVLVELSESGTLSAVTTVSTVTNMTNLNTLGNGVVTVTKAADGIPLHIANAGTMHIYNNILVS